MEYQGLTLDLDARSITTEQGCFVLPPKEFDLLLCCARRQGKILAKAQIYEAVWGEPYVYDDGNIMAVISRLRKKLEKAPSHPHYLQTVKGIGYRFTKDVCYGIAFADENGACLHAGGFSYTGRPSAVRFGG